MDVESDQIEQFRVTHFGQIDFCAAFKYILGQLLLGTNQIINTLFDATAANEFMGQHIAMLADPPGTVGRLIFHRRVPPAIEMDDMRGSSQVQPGAASFQRKNKKWALFIFLKALDQFAPLAYRRAAMQHQTFAPKDVTEKSCQRRRGFPELGEEGKWLRFTAAIIRDAAGQLVGAIETLEDITARKKAEEALLHAHEDLEHRVQERTVELARANEALLTELMERHRTQQALKETTDHLSLILESLPIVSYTRRAGGDFEITFVSNTIEEITGYPSHCFLEDKDFWKDHIHPDDCQRVISELQADRPKGTHRVGYRFRVMDDSYRWFSDYWRIIPLPASLSTYIVGAWQDVTEDKRVRQEGELRLQQMMQTHKLTALGEVVAGVAHEINNPISFIAYNVPVLEEIWSNVEAILTDNDVTHDAWKKKGLSQEDVFQHMREIIQAFKIGGSRINRIISHLKEFSRSDETTR
ncbi:MAG: hypothetical protein CVU74_05070, partial [Deltaproteobacteria bacterium HGW-Deltaproteobacteria-9]